MTRAEAFQKALALHGNSVVVGENEQYVDKPFYVCVRDNFIYTLFGAGKTWEEALAAVEPVIDLGGGKFKPKNPKKEIKTP